MLIALAAAMLVGVLMRYFLVRPVRIMSPSMEPTLLVGDLVLFRREWYQSYIADRVLWSARSSARGPRVGDVLLFRLFRGAPEFLVKRCVATSGDRVTLARSAALDADARGTAEGRRRDHLSEPTRWPSQPDLVPHGYFFALGDNPAESSDSRHWGFVRNDLVEGRAMFIYFSFAPWWSAVAGQQEEHQRASARSGPVALLRHVRWRRIGRLVR